MMRTEYRLVEWFKRQLERRNAAIILALIANAVFVVMNGMVQHLVHAHGIPSGEIIFIRMAINLPICLVWLYITTPSPLSLIFSRDAVYPWIRGFITASGILFEYAAFKLIPLTEVISIFHLRPIPVALLCFIFLGEKFIKVQMFACVMSMAAVCLIFQPPFLFPNSPSDGVDASTKLLGYSLTFIAVSFGALDLFLVRKIGETFHAIPLLALYATSCLISSPIWLLIDHSAVTLDLPLTAWLGLLFVGVSAFFGEMGLTLALQRERAGRVALTGYSQVVFAVLIQSLFVGTLPTFWGFIGMAIIFTTGIWAAVSVKSAQDDEHEALDHGSEVVDMESLESRIVDANIIEMDAVAVPLLSINAHAHS